MPGFLRNLFSPPPVLTEDFSTLQDLIVAGRVQAGSTSDAALSIAAVYRARSMNADTLASVPVRVGESLVPAPNATQSSAEFVTEIVLALEDNGDCYVSLDASGNMKVLSPGEVRVQWNDDATERLYLHPKTNRRYRTTGLVPNLIVLTVSRGVSDLTGFGPMQNPRLEGVLAAQLYSSEYFKHHGKPSGILKVPAQPTKQEAKLLKAQWDDARAVRSTAIISQQMDYQATSFSPEDSEWTQTHLVNIGEVSNLFGVPAVFLNYSPAGTSLTYQAIGDVYQGYWRMTLFPTFGKQISEMWSQVLGELVVFDPEDLFLASLRDRSMAAWQLTSVGYEPSDVLDGVGLPPIAHTGEIPTTLQPVDGSSNASN